MNCVSNNKADTPSREGGKKDEKSDLKILCIIEPHNLYDKPHLQSGQPEIILRPLNGFSSSLGNLSYLKPSLSSRRRLMFQRSSRSRSTGVSKIKGMRRNFKFPVRRRNASSPIWPSPMCSWRSTREPSGA